MSPSLDFLPQLNSSSVLQLTAVSENLYALCITRIEFLGGRLRMYATWPEFQIGGRLPSGAIGVFVPCNFKIPQVNN